MLHKVHFFRIVSLILSALLLAAMSQHVMANPIMPISAQTQMPIFTPAAPTLDAKGYVLIDANSGKVLAEKNADARMSPASLTKLMSVYIISTAIKSGSIHPEDKVRISTKAWRTGGSRMFLKPNDEVPVKDLMQGIIVASGNDASVAIAEYIAGTEDAFAGLMNQQARALGMNNSHFVDSNGLPNPNHYSSPRDLAILAQAISKKYPEDYKVFSEKWFTYNGIRQPNRNRLLWRYPLADGLKTGHTDDAGYCLVGSATKDGMRLISVIMGAPNDTSRTEDSIRLLTYGFRFYETHKYYEGLTPISNVRVWKGQQSEIPVGLAEGLYVTMPTGQSKNVQTNFQFNNPLKAPIEKGQVVGKVTVMLNTQLLSSKPIIALAADERGSLWRRMSDEMGYAFHSLFSKSSDKANNG